MSFILISGYKVLIDEEDRGRIEAAGPWHKSVDSKHPQKVYFQHSYSDGSQLLLHRFLVDAPKGKVVDHRDGDYFNCQKINLRICTSGENTMNQKLAKDNTSGYKGVYPGWKTKDGKQRWIAKIRVKGKSIYLGYFSDPLLAFNAYCDGSKKYHGEFGRIE